ncbi:MAG: Na/Pi cotransporter family protein [Pseudomonadota bacterium]
MTRAFGNSLHDVVGAAARNRITAYISGILVTCGLQSSTATSLIVASLARQGAVTTTAGLAIMLGADVGTTLAAQLLSFKVHWLAPLFILGGYVVYSRNDHNPKRHFGRIAIGLGLLMLSLRMIMDATDPLRSHPIMLDVIQAMAGEPLLCLLLAAGITWLAHSSLATVLLVMSMAAGGALPMEAAFMLVLGANLGGVIAPIMASASYEPAGRRVPVANALVRIIGVLIAIPLIGVALQYIPLAGTDPARQVVNFHTAFNLILSLAALPWCHLVARVLIKMIPDQPSEDVPGLPLYLDDRTLDTPSVAITQAGREARRMADLLSVMMHQSMAAIRDDDATTIKRVQESDDALDQLYDRIKLFVTQVSFEDLDPKESARAMEIITFVTNIEHAGDIIDKSLMDMADKKREAGISFSAEGIKEIESLHAKLCASLDLAIGVFTTRDPELARDLLARKADMRELERGSYDAHLLRLVSGNTSTIESSSIHLDIIRDLRRIHSHLVAIAYAVLDRNGLPSADNGATSPDASRETNQDANQGTAPEPRKTPSLSDKLATVSANAPA